MPLIFNRKTGNWEDTDNATATQFLASASPVGAGASGSWGEPEPAPAQAMNPIVKAHLMKKVATKRAPAVDPVEAAPAPMPMPEIKPEPSQFEKFQSEYGDEKYKQAQAEADEARSGLGWSQFAAGLGDALAGRSPHETNKNFEGIRKGIDDRTVGAFEKSKKNALENFTTKRTMDEAQRTDVLRQREDDVNSDESKIAQSLLVKMGMDPEQAKKMNATRFKEISPTMQKMYELQQRALDRSEARNERRFLQGIKVQEKQERNDEQDMQKLSKDVAGTQDMIHALDEVEKVLGSPVDKFNVSEGKLMRDGKKVDLPGVSIPLIGRTSFYNSDARDLNGAASKVFNATLKDRSGATITDTELERLKTEFQEGKFNTEEELVKGLQAYKRQVNAVLKNREAGYNPRVVSKYTDQGGRTSKTIQGPSQSQGQPSMVKILTPKGQTKLVSKELLPDALAAGAKLFETTAGQ